MRLINITQKDKFAVMNLLEAALHGNLHDELEQAEKPFARAYTALGDLGSLSAIVQIEPGSSAAQVNDPDFDMKEKLEQLDAERYKLKGIDNYVRSILTVIDGDMDAAAKLAKAKDYLLYVRKIIDGSAR